MEESTYAGVIARLSLYNTLFPGTDKDNIEYCRLSDMQYLAYYPNIKKAIQQGIFKNGFEYFVKYRHGNKRTCKCMYLELNVEEKDLFEVNKRYFVKEIKL